MLKQNHVSSPRLIVCSLADSIRDDRSLSPFKNLGFVVERILCQNLLNAKLPPNTLYLMQVGEAWNEAFEWVSRIPVEIRAALVLLGRRKRRKRLLARTIELGILATVAKPVPQWFPRLLREALPRISKWQYYDLAHTLREIEGAFEFESPESLMEILAALAGRILGAELSVATIMHGNNGRPKALVRNTAGVIEFEDWEDDASRRQVPTGLASLVFRRNELFLWPNVNHWRPTHGPELPSYLAVMIQPIKVPADSSRKEGIPLVASINLYWRNPYLPTPSELAVFGALMTLVRAAAWRLYEQSRAASIHDISRKVFTLNLEREPAKQSEAVDRTSGPCYPDSPADLLMSLIRAYATWRGLISLKLHYPAAWETPWEKKELNFPEDGSARPTRRPQLNDLPNDSCGKLRDGLWCIRQSLVPGQLHQGEVIVHFSGELEANVAVSDVQRLANDVQYLIRAERQAADSAALRQMPTAPTGERQAEDDLKMALKLICERTDSDGAKAYLILRSDGVPMKWQLWNTDISRSAQVPQRIASDYGLANWVIRNSDWLLLPDRDTAQLAGSAAEFCWTGRNGEVQIRAVSETVEFPDLSAPDNEKTMIFLPMSARGNLAGVLAIWRCRKEAYSRHDPERLLSFVPPVEAACLRTIQLRKANEEREAVAVLSRVVSESKSLPEFYTAIARATVALLNAAAALLLLKDQPTGFFYLASAWGSNLALGSRIRVELCRYRFAASRGPNQLKLELMEKVRELQIRKVMFHSPGHMKAQDTGGADAEAFANAEVALVVLDERQAEIQGPFVTDELMEHFAESYLQAARAALHGFPTILSSRLIDEIGDPLQEGTRTPREVLVRSAELLRTATGAEAALLYQGTPRNMRRSSVLPPIELGKAPELERPGPLASKCVQAREAHYLLDHSEAAAGDRRVMRAYQERSDWSGVGSWLCCPIVHQGHSIGLIKLLTSATGPYLCAGHVPVAKQLAQGIAAEMHRSMVGQQVTELLEMSRSLTVYHGAALAMKMVEKLESWLHQTLNRPDCRVGVVAFTPSDGRKLLSAMVPRDGSTAHLEYLEKFSLPVAKSSAASRAQRTSVAHFELEGLQCIGVQIALPSEDRLDGHLFALDVEEFFSDDFETLARAAHYLAFALDTERERSMARQAMGRFRHALFGPSQGLVEAAELVLLEAGHALSPRDRRTVEEVVIKEAEILRLWRENQRFYLGEEIRLRKTRFSLRQLITRCISRYERMANFRDIGIRYTFVEGRDERRDLYIRADEPALDLALSNLLENACKYSFSHQIINVSVHVDTHLVQICVEDVGHPVPDEIGAAIYEVGRRGVEHDPFRLILGQGLGLAMATIAANLHDGQLTHKSARLFKGKTREQDGFKVQFKLELPWTNLK